MTSEHEKRPLLTRRNMASGYMYLRYLLRVSVKGRTASRAAPGQATAHRYQTVFDGCPADAAPSANGVFGRGREPSGPLRPALACRACQGPAAGRGASRAGPPGPARLAGSTGTVTKRCGRVAARTVTKRPCGP